jgi:hypothetical protein
MPFCTDEIRATLQRLSVALPRESRSHRRRSHLLADAAYTPESLNQESVEGRMLSDLELGEETLVELFEEIVLRISNDPRNSYLMDLPIDGFNLRHASNIDQALHELADYDVALEEIKLHEAAILARSVQNRILGVTHQEAKAAFESDNGSLGQLRAERAELQSVADAILSSFIEISDEILGTSNSSYDLTLPIDRTRLENSRSQASQEIFRLSDAMIDLASVEDILLARLEPNSILGGNHQAAKAAFELDNESFGNSHAKLAAEKERVKQHLKMLLGKTILYYVDYDLNFWSDKETLPYGSRPRAYPDSRPLVIEQVRDDMNLTTVAAIQGLDLEACLNRLKILYRKGYKTNPVFEGLWTNPPIGTPAQWILKYGPSPLFDARTADVAQLQDRLLDYLGFTDDERAPRRPNTRSTRSSRSNSSIDY